MYRESMNRLSGLVLGTCIIAVSGCTPAGRSAPPADLPALTAESASNFARVTLACVGKQYPNAPGYVLNADDDVQAPKRVHPAFSAAMTGIRRSTLMPARLPACPTLPERGEIVRALETNLTAENIAIEAAFRRPGMQARAHLRVGVGLEARGRMHRSASTRSGGRHQRSPTRSSSYLISAQDLPDSHRCIRIWPSVWAFALDMHRRHTPRQTAARGAQPYHFAGDTEYSGCSGRQRSSKLPDAPRPPPAQFADCSYLPRLSARAEDLLTRCRDRPIRSAAWSSGLNLVGHGDAPHRGRPSAIRAPCPRPPYHACDRRPA